MPDIDWLQTVSCPCKFFPATFLPPQSISIILVVLIEKESKIHCPFTAPNKTGTINKRHISTGIRTDIWFGPLLCWAAIIWSFKRQNSSAGNFRVYGKSYNGFKFIKQSIKWAWKYPPPLGVPRQSIYCLLCTDSSWNITETKPKTACYQSTTFSKKSIINLTWKNLLKPIHFDHSHKDQLIVVFLIIFC